MLRFFDQPWQSVPVCVIDTETTGLRLGRDEACSIGLVRFESGQAVSSRYSLICPSLAIPENATAIHGITDEMVSSSPTIDAFFEQPETLALLDGAQPLAYNAGYDRYFVVPFGDDWSWPWLDCLSLVRKVDRFAKGTGRHRLEPTCARHGVALTNAHNAEADARAAGELFYKLAPNEFHKHATLGAVLAWQRRAEAEEWFRFNDWLSRKQKEEACPTGNQ